MRNDTCLALAGGLLSAGYEVEDVDDWVANIAELAGDDEWQSRRVARETKSKMERAISTTGLPRLIELLDLPESMHSKFQDWLGITDAPDPRPRIIYVENRLGEVLDQTERAMIDANLPIYQMSGRLVLDWESIKATPIMERPDLSRSLITATALSGLCVSS